MIPRPTPLYHITSVQNLPLILRVGGLLCSNLLDLPGSEYTNIAYSAIQERRARKAVPCGPGGTIYSYVPFFFGPRPLMLFTINKGNVPGAMQADIIYLVTTVETVSKSGRSFVFTDGHAVSAFTRFFDDLLHLDKVPWEVMFQPTWSNTMDNPDRMRRRQSEFLVHWLAPWRLILEIGVIDSRMRTRVLQLLDNAEPKPVVRVRRGWYY